ncbi:MAG: protease complex subunit PrcB family protein [Pyrinomonadaceae bacterium]
MLKLRTVIIFALLPLIFNAASVAACDAAQKRRASGAKEKQRPSQEKSGIPMNKNRAPDGKENTVNGDVKILAEGGYGRVGEPVLIVARDTETYAALRSGLANSLPELSADFFKTNAVVAAFLGTRRTGGYTAQITRDAASGTVRVATTSPGEGQLSAQVISAPFKIASVPLAADENLALEMDDIWKQRLRPYRVSEGQFTMSGGIAGRREQFRFGGELRIMRYRNFATIVFALKSMEGTKPRALNGALTGTVSANGSLALAQLAAGSFTEHPSSNLAVKGMFIDAESNVSFTFAPLPTNVADGFSGEGNLKAVATAPAPPKAKPSMIDEEM